MARRRHSETDEIKAALKRPPAIKKVTSADLLHTGSTMLNLAATGKPNGGWVKGTYTLFVGDSSSGKTWFCIAALAEACRNPEFDDYELIYDNVERGALMDMRRFFGKRAAQRIIAPRYDGDAAVFSEKIEDFYDNLHDHIESEVPFIYILDSMDALDSEAGEEKYLEQKTAREKGKDSAGSFGDGKAKVNSQNIRRMVSRLARNGSILIVINQTRDNLKPGSFDPKTRSGGKALTFYATYEMWSSIKSHIYKTVRGKKRELGIVSLVKVKKSRSTGRMRTAEVPIYHSHGIDDVGACIAYLIDEGHWSATKTGKVVAEEFEFEGTVEKLVQHIEDNELEQDLSAIVADVWNDVEAACAVKRKSRYE